MANLMTTDSSTACGWDGTVRVIACPNASNHPASLLGFLERVGLSKVAMLRFDALSIAS